MRRGQRGPQPPALPRALLTPFTDHVQLTSGDERAYTSAAKAQRNKGFQQIDVSFHPGDPPDAGASNSHDPAHTGASRRAPDG